jgi:hypothetical protein
MNEAMLTSSAQYFINIAKYADMLLIIIASLKLIAGIS